MKRASKVYLVGKTRGSGRADFGNPAEADFAVAVKGQSAFVSVNGEVTEYTLSVNQSSRGEYGATAASSRIFLLLRLKCCFECGIASCQQIGHCENSAHVRLQAQRVALGVVAPVARRVPDPQTDIG